MMIAIYRHELSKSSLKKNSYEITCAEVSWRAGKTAKLLVSRRNSLTSPASEERALENRPLHQLELSQKNLGKCLSTVARLDNWDCGGFSDPQIWQILDQIPVAIVGTFTFSLIPQSCFPIVEFLVFVNQHQNPHELQITKKSENKIMSKTTKTIPIKYILGLQVEPRNLQSLGFFKNLKILTLGNSWQHHMPKHWPFGFHWATVRWHHSRHQTSVIMITDRNIEPEIEWHCLKKMEDILFKFPTINFSGCKVLIFWFQGEFFCR